MNNEAVQLAKREIEAIPDLLERAPEPIVISWEAWQASRAKKREILKAYGLDASSRRQHGYGSAERRLRKAFGAKRVPAFG